MHPVFVLAGGFGTRLRPVVDDRPKALAAIGNVPFLRLQLSYLQRQGIDRVVLCLGHQASMIVDELHREPVPGLSIATSIESSPLGTAGALCLASDYLGDAKRFFVMNGDTFVECDLRKLESAFHLQALGVIGVRRIDDAREKGVVSVSDEGRIVDFSEKQSQGPALINAGVYCFASEILQQIPTGRAVSLEQEMFPKFIASPGGVYAHELTGEFVDIGTPDEYVRAQRVLSRESKLPDH